MKSYNRIVCTHYILEACIVDFLGVCVSMSITALVFHFFAIIIRCFCSEWNVYQHFISLVSLPFSNCYIVYLVRFCLFITYTLWICIRIQFFFLFSWFWFAFLSLSLYLLYQDYLFWLFLLSEVALSAHIMYYTFETRQKWSHIAFCLWFVCCV